MNLTSKSLDMGFPLGVTKKGSSGLRATRLAIWRLLTRLWGLMQQPLRLAMNLLTPIFPLSFFFFHRVICIPSFDKIRSRFRMKEWSFPSFLPHISPILKQPKTPINHGSGSEVSHICVLHDERKHVNGDRPSER